MSDSGNSPLIEERGVGYKGDFEFIFYEKDGEDLIFRGNKTNGNKGKHVEIRFVKAASNGLDNLKEAFKSKVKINPILEGSTTSSVYRVFSIAKGNLVTSFGYNYNSVLRSFSFKNDLELLSSPVFFTATGFGLSEIKIGDEKYTDIEFSYDEYDATADRVSVQVENATFTLGGGNSPPTPLDHHKRIIDPKIIKRLTYYHKDEDLPSGLTTSTFEALADGLSLTTPIRFLNDGNIPGLSTPADFFDIRTMAKNISALYTYEDKDDRIIFVRNGGTLPTTPEQEAFLDFLFDDEGFYVENLGPITGFLNDIYTFTSVKNPSMRLAWYAD